MAEHQIRFEDGAAYERNMGTWSRLAGEVFLDWLAPRPGLRWIDIGCGSGAFTELLIDRRAPAEVYGIDPSTGTACLRASAVGRTRGGVPSRGRDGAPLPRRQVRCSRHGVGDLLRSRSGQRGRRDGAGGSPGRPGRGYAWDMAGGGFPMHVIQAEMRRVGLDPPLAPSSGASRMEALGALWAGAGLEAVETRNIAVQRTFADFGDFWSTSLLTANLGSIVAAMAPGDVERLKGRVQARLPLDAAGRLTYVARANAIKGSKPK